MFSSGGLRNIVFQIVFQSSSSTDKTKCLYIPGLFKFAFVMIH